MKNSRQKWLLLFPDGVGVRNYLYPELFDADAQELWVFHNFNAETMAYLRSVRRFEHEETLPDYRESIKERFLRELISLSRLRYNAQKTGNDTVLVNWNPKPSSRLGRLMYALIERLARPNFDRILKWQARYEKAIRRNPFYRAVQQRLREIAPDQIFCSHQRALKMPAFFAAARDLGIPTATVIYSWDNLPKGRMALQADRYLVWSEHMKQEMALFYPDVPQHAVVVTGTPQFSFYADANLLEDRASFCGRFGLDPAKKTICFSGDDEMTSPDDPQYLQDLAQAIAQAGLDNQMQILLRRSPVDFSGRYDAVAERYPFIKQAPPLWNRPADKGWADVFPLTDDVALLVNTVFHCDVVVNLGSTMAFDFSMFDKPCVFLGYDQPVRKNPLWSVDKVYRFQHFRSMPSTQAVYWFKRQSEIIPVLQQALTHGMPKQMEAWRDTVVGDTVAALKNVSTLAHWQ